MKLSKIVLGLVLSTTLALAPSTTEAQTTSSTSWVFHVTYGSGQFSDSRDPSLSGPILMYTGASWTCRREAVSLNKTGSLVAGFMCFSAAGAAGTGIAILAACSATETDGDSNRVLLSEPGIGSVVLAVACQTKAPQPKAVRSQDKNL